MTIDALSLFKTVDYTEKNWLRNLKVGFLIFISISSLKVVVILLKVTYNVTH
jgi:hypothetical protein